VDTGLGAGVGLTVGHALSDAYGWGRGLRTLVEVVIAVAVGLLVVRIVGLMARRRP
jgi:hypothetical protein